MDFNNLECSNKSKIFKIIDRGISKEAKYCLECGRVFTNRKKWEHNFENVKFCSKACKFNNKFNSRKTLI
ncbi:MAG: DUF2256 domain-containing protein [Candidatus Woesearchaeota archaeon]